MHELMQQGNPGMEQMPKPLYGEMCPLTADCGCFDFAVAPTRSARCAALRSPYRAGKGVMILCDDLGRAHRLARGDRPDPGLQQPPVLKFKVQLALPASSSHSHTPRLPGVLRRAAKPACRQGVSFEPSLTPLLMTGSPTACSRSGKGGRRPIPLGPTYEVEVKSGAGVMRAGWNYSPAVPPS